MKFLYILLSLFFCFVSASYEHLAFQLAVGIKVYPLVRKECPDLVFKMATLKGGFKKMRKELGAHRIKDLTRFEVGLDENTLKAYCAWVCSNSSPRQISTFPSIQKLNADGFGSAVDIETSAAVSEGFDSLSQVEDDAYDGYTQRYSSPTYLYFGFLVFGLFLGGFAVQCYYLHSTHVGKKVTNNGLRRPEL